MDPNRWKTLGKLAVSLIAAGVLAAGVAMPVVLGSGILARNEASRFLDTTCDLQESAPPQKTYMYARDGKTLIATLFSQDRQLVPLSSIPTYLRDALVATEDRRFYTHHGVDLRGLLRSAVSTSGGDTQGGSTLTMQYVKQIRYFQAGDNLAKQKAAVAQTLQRKIEDAKCALYFEGAKHESKDQILNNYLNIAFFGENAYGIATAAETYFDKPVSQLTLAQSSLLVGLLRAPGYYDPFYNPTGAKARRDEVIQNLVSVGKLSQKVADEQKATPIALATKSPPKLEEGCANAPSTIKNVAFFCEYAKSWLENVNGISEQQLNTGGYKIITTLDADIQNSAQDRIAKSVPATARSTAVLPAIDPKSGDVLAMASSKTFGSAKGQTEQPMFTSTTAFGASTFKLFPLLTALSTGIPSDFQLSTVGNTGTYSSTKCASPNKVINGDANVSYNTVESLASATAKSSNSYFVSLAENMLSCQLGPIVDLMKNLGMTGLDQPSDDNAKQTVGQVIVNAQRAQQLVLGSVTASPLQLAAAYAAVADGGIYNAPSPILSITDASNQNVALKRDTGRQVIAPQVAAQAVQILEGDTRQSGTSADAFTNWYSDNDSLIAGKTGTVEANPKKYPGKNASIWFVGMTPDLVATSGIIDFDSTAVPSAGLPGEKDGAAYGSYAAKVWLAALKPSLVKRNWQWPDPDSLPGSTVPDVSGETQSAARKTLAADGFKMTVLGGSSNAQCASSEPFESVGYYGPQKAQPGSTITVCLSSQVPAYSPPVYNPPVRNSGGGGQGNTSGSTGGTTGGGTPRGTTGGGRARGTTGGTTGGSTPRGTTGGTTGGGTGATTR